jgi:hypothetical protein
MVHSVHGLRPPRTHCRCATNRQIPSRLRLLPSFRRVFTEMTCDRLPLKLGQLAMSYYMRVNTRNMQAALLYRRMNHRQLTNNVSQPHLQITSRPAAHATVGHFTVSSLDSYTVCLTTNNCQLTGLS